MFSSIFWLPEEKHSRRPRWYWCLCLTFFLSLAEMRPWKASGMHLYNSTDVWSARVKGQAEIFRVWGNEAERRLNMHYRQCNVHAVQTVWPMQKTRKCVGRSIWTHTKFDVFAFPTFFIVIQSLNFTPRQQLYVNAMVKLKKIRNSTLTFPKLITFNAYGW